MKYFVIYLLPVILVLFMGSSILSTNSAFGLSCDATNITWSFEETDAIFLGKALSKEYQPNPRHEDRFDAVTLFSIIEPYKGIYQEKIKVISSEWLWGVNFTENSDYVVFANNNEGNMEHALCTPTQLAAESNLSEIRKISQNYILPPLSQIDFGVNSNEIQCKQNLVLIQKYDGSPACVTESTKQKLIERGWTTNESTTKADPARTTPSEPPFDEKDPQTKIEIAFDERLDDKLLPIKITEVTTNAKNLDEITVWNFEPIGNSGDDRRVAWDTLPEEHRMWYNIVDDESQDIQDYDRKDLIYIPLDLHAYRMNCGIFQTVSGESAHPTTFPIKTGVQTVFVQNSRIGIYPDSEGKYSLEFASIFPHDIRFPEDTETITYDTKECRLLQDIEEVEGEYNKGYYTKITFRYLDK